MPAALIAELSAKVGAEHAALQELMVLLENERAILLSPGIDGLTALLERKTEVARRISSLTQQRYLVLGKAGFAANESGMQAFLADQQGEQSAIALSALWKKLGAFAREVKAYNLFNGQLVSGLMARNRDLLTVLGLVPKTGGNLLYGPDGRSSRFGSSIR